MKKAFTMVELIFVIVILGILAAVAVPKMGSTKTNAEIAKARTDVASIRSSILSERQSQLIKGVNSFIEKLSSDDEILFTGDSDKKRTLLTYGISAGKTSGKWEKVDDATYKFHVGDDSIEFKYDKDTGKFTCTRDDADTGDICKKIVD